MATRSGATSRARPRRPTPPPDCVWTDQGSPSGSSATASWRGGGRTPTRRSGPVPCYANTGRRRRREADVFFEQLRPRDDPRYVTLLVTREYPPGPGRELIPVKYWAGFYVTGWTPHHTQAPACPDNDPPPPGAKHELEPVGLLRQRRRSRHRTSLRATSSARSAQTRASASPSWSNRPVTSRDVLGSGMMCCVSRRRLM